MALSNNMNALLDGTLNVGKKDVGGEDQDKAEHQDDKINKLKGNEKGGASKG